MVFQSWLNLKKLKLIVRSLGRLKAWNIEPSFVIGWGFSIAVERRPAQKNSWGCGFDSGWVLGFFLLFQSLSSVSLIKSLNEEQHYWFPLKNMLSCSARVKTSIICRDLKEKHQFCFISCSLVGLSLRVPRSNCRPIFHFSSKPPATASATHLAGERERKKWGRSGIGTLKSPSSGLLMKPHQLFRETFSHLYKETHLLPLEQDFETCWSFIHQVF